MVMVYEIVAEKLPEVATIEKVYVPSVVGVPRRLADVGLVCVRVIPGGIEPPEIVTVVIPEKYSVYR
jgi:hypothetical protein